MVNGWRRYAVRGTGWGRARLTITYADGTQATTEQMAHDVVTFLTWASEPKMEERKRMGFAVMIFLLALTGLLFLAYRKLWSDQH